MCLCCHLALNTPCVHLLLLLWCAGHSIRKRDVRACERVSLPVCLFGLLLPQEIEAMRDEAELKAGAAREGVAIADAQTAKATEEANILRCVFWTGGGGLGCPNMTVYALCPEWGG